MKSMVTTALQKRLRHSVSAVLQRRLEALPAEVCSLQRLQRLDVSANALAVLPAAVSQLTSLRSLAARQNRLAALPPELGACSALQVRAGEALVKQHSRGWSIQHSVLVDLLE